jgi:hypothetical protein
MKHTFRRCLPSRRVSHLLLAAGLVAACSGCSVLGAKPWDHDLLSERAMQVNPYPLESAMDDHIYFSKEASSGGRSYAGGGCGCN